MKLGRFFTLDEMSVSQTAVRRGIVNRPGPREVDHLRALVVNILDPLRAYLGTPIVVTSGYRSPTVNKLVKGSATSQHVLGQAADIIVPGHSVSFVCAAIRRLKLPYDQLIDEFGEWTHVSYGPLHRRDFLTARRVAGKTVYRRVP